jgi:hypothetical protein
VSDTEQRSSHVSRGYPARWHSWTQNGSIRRLSREAVIRHCFRHSSIVPPASSQSRLHFMVLQELAAGCALVV